MCLSPLLYARMYIKTITFFKLQSVNENLTLAAFVHALMVDIYYGYKFVEEGAVLLLSKLSK